MAQMERWYAAIYSIQVFAGGEGVTYFGISDERIWISFYRRQEESLSSR